MTGLLGRLFWPLVAIAAVSVGLAAGPLPWRLAGESGLPRPPPAGAERAAAEPVSLDPILSLGPFGRVVNEAAPAPAAEETDLGLTLHGVVISATPDLSSAIISSEAQPARTYRVGQTIVAEAVLVEVHGEQVVLDVGGRRETLSFPESRSARPRDRGVSALQALVHGQSSAAPAAAAAATDPEAIIARYRERITANPQQVLDGLGLVATEAGYEIGGDAPASVRRAGLQPGDVVAKVNGQQVGEVESDRRLFDEVAASGRARLEVLRGGQRIVMSFPLR